MASGGEGREVGICRELLACKTASSVVRTTRALLERSWHISWGALALLLIAQKSTPTTRKEWVRDSMVKRLVAYLEEELSVHGKAARLEATSKVEAFGERAVEECLTMLSARLDAELMALEAFRRLSLQTAEGQREKLLEMADELRLLGWGRSAERTVRYLWLAAPIEAGGRSSPAPPILPALIALRTGAPELKPDFVAPLCTSLAARSALKRPVAVAIQDLDATFCLMDLLKERRKGYTSDFEGFIVSLDVLVHAGVPTKLSMPLPLVTISSSRQSAEGEPEALWTELCSILMLPGGTELALVVGSMQENLPGLSWEKTEEPPLKKAKKSNDKAVTPAPVPPRVLPIKKMNRLRLEVSAESITVFVDGVESLTKSVTNSEIASKGDPSQPLPNIRLYTASIQSDHTLPTTVTTAVTIVGEAAAATEAATAAATTSAATAEEGAATAAEAGENGPSAIDSLTGTDAAAASATAAAPTTTTTAPTTTAMTTATTVAAAAAAPSIQGSISNITCRLPGRSPVCDPQLMARVIQQLRRESFYTRILCSEVIDLADALVVLDVREEGVWRSLGQSVLQRKAELSTLELWRLKVGLQFAGLTQQTVWAALGFERSNRKGNVITTQAFRPHRGHEKNIEGDEVEQVSPCKEVEEYCLR